MNENQFNQKLDELMMAIEDAIEEQELDIDYETSAGILTLTCPNNSQIILSRQTPLLQLWLAAKSGGFHFDFDAGKGEWVCKGELLIEVLNRCLCDQCGTQTTIEL
ncbi:frataxin [Endozoicomonas montiporae]|uniref:Iron-sulfur cluster assembly protein CyaY n=2 Tax=Endozoicomonas montiporae TaxID=1027273 RepID=A0A081N209_9GAMM|nr:iron donor protein CyaY [Endozoicomonas montiporae]AMO58566.1 frataxin-like protein [Endozoicomonas montiporae CL-33]KEQ12482.1 frataxin [Endozoicomonas montiporae]